jgi:Flp pilus assembly protein TadG
MPPRLMVGSRRRKLADEGGVALVEFALVLPLVLLLLFGMIDVGKAVNYWNDETHLANEAARFAAVDNSSDPNWAGNKTNAAYKINTAVKNHADSAELKTGGTHSISSPGVRICLWFPNNTITTDDPARDHRVGDPVQVVVTAQYNWLGYLVGQGVRARSSLTATSTMRLEQQYRADGTDAYTTGSANATNASGTC